MLSPTYFTWYILEYFDPNKDTIKKEVHSEPTATLLTWLLHVAIVFKQEGPNSKKK